MSMTKAQIKRDLEWHKYFRVFIEDNSNGEGRSKIFEEIADASIYISQHIGKAYRITFTKEIELRTDANIAKLIKLLDDE